MIYSKDEVEKETLKYFNNDELATNSWITKYALKNKKGEFLELTPKDMHVRLSKEFSRIEKKYSNPIIEEDVFEMLKNFKYIVPQGSPMYGIGNDFVSVSLSNCVVVAPPEDNMTSIINSGRDMANLFKQRCGVGTDLSYLRPEGMRVNNSAGTTTGAWSFADFYSYICRMVGQSGRRGALILTMDIKHPDIEKFITMKNDLKKVTGANVSIKISDEFMNSVKEDKDFILSYPIESKNPIFTKIVKAKNVWNMIIESATKTAEPGILMWDTIKRNLPSNEYEKFKVTSTNPCSELPLSNFGACRLISINLKNLVNNRYEENSNFDFDLFKKVIKISTRLSDDLIDLEIEKISNIIEKVDTTEEKELWNKLLENGIKGREIGLGTHGLSDVFNGMNIKYDSEKALELTDKIYECLRDESYRESCNLAKERGSFPIFDWEVEKNNTFLNRLPIDIIDLIKKNGRRNISLLTNAPTGTVSILSQTSSGIEPVFRNFYIRRRKLFHDEQNTKVDFKDEIGDSWSEYKIYHHSVLEWIKKFNKSLEEIPDFFITSDLIKWEKRIELQSIIQKYIDHSISSTINLPNGTNKEIVEKIYFKAWESGLKGVTVYVDGSRSGVLLEDKKNKKEEKFISYNAPKRLSKLKCEINHTTIEGKKWSVFVGLYENKPYEIFAGEERYVQLPKKYQEGIIEKIKNKNKNEHAIYNLIVGKDEEEIIIKDIVKIFNNPINAAFTRILSLSMRHGCPIHFIVEQLQKEKDSDMLSFNKVVARVLKKYIPNGQISSLDKICSSCGKEGLIYDGGCVQCKECGWSKC